MPKPAQNKHPSVTPPAQKAGVGYHFTIAIIVAGTCYAIPMGNTQSKSLIMVLM
jgi:hypothetical protein